MNNMKSTCPMPNASPSRWGPNPTYIPPARVGGWQILAFKLGVSQTFAFLDTNMLVSTMQNYGIGGLNQSEDPMRIVLRHSEI